MSDRVKPIRCALRVTPSIIDLRVSEAVAVRPIADAERTGVPMLAIDRRDLDSATMPAHAVDAVAQELCRMAVESQESVRVYTWAQCPDAGREEYRTEARAIIAAYIAALREDRCPSL